MFLVHSVLTVTLIKLIEIWDVKRGNGIKSIWPSHFWLPVNKNDCIMEIQNQITDLGFISGIFEFYVYFSEVGFWILCL